MSKAPSRDRASPAQTPRRPKLHSSLLLHTLAELSLADTTAADVAFAPSLAQWLPFTQAIRLSALLAQPVPASPGGQPRHTATAALTARLAQVRAQLEGLITQACTPKVFQAQVELHNPRADEIGQAPSTWEAYRRYYASLQRDMEQAILELRTAARDALSQTSPALRKLAQLDATLDAVLSERETQQLARLPGLLEQRFAARPTDGSVAQPPSTDGRWSDQADLRPLFQSLLMAELDLRLQTVTGLVEALKQHPTTAS